MTTLTTIILFQPLPPGLCRVGSWPTSFQTCQQRQARQWNIWKQLNHFECAIWNIDQESLIHSFSNHDSQHKNMFLFSRILRCLLIFINSSLIGWLTPRVVWCIVLISRLTFNILWSLLLFLSCSRTIITTMMAKTRVERYFCDQN